MYNRLIRLIHQHFNIEIINIKIITSHSQYNDSKVYLIESVTKKYALKEMAPDNKLEDEGSLISFLLSKEVKVPKIYHTTAGHHTFTNNGLQYILYEFIEGTTFDLNTAPQWLLTKSAQTLGRIHNALTDYKQMLIEIGLEIFSEEELASETQFITDKIKKSIEENDIQLTAALNERLKHIKKISKVKFDCAKFTYVNTHGDF